MIEINGKVYRNLQEQVEKLTNDLEDTATKQYVDNSISAIYGDFYTKDQADDRFPTETHMNLLLGYKQDKLTTGTGIDITNNTIAVDNTVALKTDLPDMNDYVVKSIDGEDVEYGINYGLSNNTPQLFGADNYGSHPCDARVQVTYDSIHINANDYNHGDNDDTYTGSIDVTDGYVDIEATNGEDTTTLRVSPSGVTVNGSSIAKISDVPTVVDTVADGNMNAVTSNAVYDIVGNIETLLAAI